MLHDRYLFAKTVRSSPGWRRSALLFFQACSIATVMTLFAGMLLPAQASPAAGFIAFEGTLTVSSPLASDPPTGPSPTLTPVGSGEDFPVSGGNETCGQNNRDGGVWSTHVPDPLVDEIGFCEGATSTGGSLPGNESFWSVNIGTEPPDICRGGLTHDETAGHVCTLWGNGFLDNFLGSGARCEFNRGSSGTISVQFENPAVGSPSSVELRVAWTAAVGGTALVTGTVRYVDGSSHSGNVVGLLHIVPKTECLSGGATQFTVIGELAFETA